MADISPSTFYVIVGLLLLISICVGWRCDTLSKRIDIVHKRISQNSKINNLIDRWDDQP